MGCCGASNSELYVYTRNGVLMLEQEIINLYRPLHSFIRKRVSNPSDAEDLTQEVFLKLSCQEFSKVNNLKGWIFTVAKNAIIDYYRKRKLEFQILEDQILKESPDTPNVLQDLSECVLTFIEMLPKDYRKLLKLAELDGIPQKEIATQLGLNYVTVRSKIRRGRQLLKAMFIECCKVEQGGRNSLLHYQNQTSCCK